MPLSRLSIGQKAGRVAREFLRRGIDSVSGSPTLNPPDKRGFNPKLVMADMIYYLGAEAEDFATISAAFKQMARDVELHFAAFPEELLDRLNTEGRMPTVIFVALDPERAAPMLRELKSHHAACWVPTILIGDSPHEAQAERLVSCGAVAYLRRPVQTNAVQRLFSATGELILRPSEDGALLSLSGASAPRAGPGAGRFPMG